MQPSLGGLLKGLRWEQPKDTLGLGFSANWISNAHAQYLAIGVSMVLSVTTLSPRPQNTWLMFSTVKTSHPFWISADYQHISNPGYNSARGPVNVFGVRAHLEF